MELVGTIQNVTGRKVNTKFGEKNVYDIHFSDGNIYGTFKEPLAAEARRAQGLDGVKISVEQNGDFFNFGGVLSLNGNVPADETANIPMVEGTTTDDRQARIHRQTAFKVAAMALDNPSYEELEALALRVEKAFSGELPNWSE